MNIIKKEESTPSDDVIDNIISTYADHPSIKIIDENVVKGVFSFTTVNLTAVEKEIAALDMKKVSITNSIPPKLLKENSDIVVNP